MRDGPLFRCYKEDFNHAPSTTRCSTLPYKELKQMAKNLYPDTKSAVRVMNPLKNYQRKDKNNLAIAVYDALRILY